MAMVDSGACTGGDTAPPPCTEAERLQVQAAVRPQPHVFGPPCPPPWFLGDTTSPAFGEDVQDPQLLVPLLNTNHRHGPFPPTLPGSLKKPEFTFSN